MHKLFVDWKRVTKIFIFSVLGTVVLVQTCTVNAQNIAEKIQLLAEALQARDSGDLALAKNKAGELSKMDTGDEAVRQLLDSIHNEPLVAISTETEQKDNKSDIGTAANKVGLFDGSESAELDRNLNIIVEPDNTENSSANKVGSDYLAQEEIIRDLLKHARTQYLSGDYDGAIATFKEVEARDANNVEAKLFQARIAEILSDIHVRNKNKTRQQMLTEVDQSWERPKVFDVDTTQDSNTGKESGILQQMKSIVIPQVNFSGMELTRVIDALSELSVEYDPSGAGVNIVPLFDSNKRNPRVTISLRNLNLDLILKFVTQQVDFSYNVGPEAVTVDISDALDGESSNITEFFPISRATIIRLTGFRDVDTFPRGQMKDSSAEPSAIKVAKPSVSEEVDALKRFFQSAGVNFGLPGANLAFDGEQLIVTQTSRNLERMRVILRNYNEVKQVEIEAKFLEVTQGDLEELGFDWNVGKNGETIFKFGESINQPDQFGVRTIADGFGADLNKSSIRIENPGATTTSIDNEGNSTSTVVNALSDSIAALPPILPNTVDLGADGLSLSSLARSVGVGAYDVDFAIRALSRKTGSDLMSAPKVTVLSGKRATITVAQELRYPESFGDIEAEVSPGDQVDGGSGIAITAGTPRDFTIRNVGVEMSVTPNVQSDDTISLILEPRVTEFEGFVEYGGPSVAIQGGTTVTVPSGFYQPIFSTREITTEVTIFDGATVVMGGLTRDEIKTVKDKVPVLGDIPGIGRLFRSEGETRLKRNLLIFVTANLVSPGGSPANQSYRNVSANSLFQNPTLMTPGGRVNRSIDAIEEKK